MKYFLLYIALLLSSHKTAFSFQINDTLKTHTDSVSALPDIYINKIIIAGNDVTEDEIVLREISLKENSKLDFKILEEDVQKIYKLGLFNKVDVIPLPTDTLNKVNLMFLVEERFYIIPLPQGGFRNGNLSNFWVGLNLIWNNFRGRNETASLSFGVGYEPFVNLSYSVPWIGKNAHYFTSVSAGYSVIYNKNLQKLNDSTSQLSPTQYADLKNHNFNTSLSFGKFFQKNFSLNAILGYHIVQITDTELRRTLSSDGQDNYLTFSFSGNYDTRNSNELTMSGSLYSLEYIKYGFANNFDFSRINFDARKFIPVKLSDSYAITLASRFMGIVSFGGTIPGYLNQFYGYDKIIRGYKNIILEGENQTGLFSEIRIPIVNPFYISGKSVPLAKKVSLLRNISYKFGLTATLFFDVGSVWNKNDNIFNTRFYNGFGAGLNFILPFGFVGRTDFAFRKELSRFYPQVIFDLEASF